MRFYLKKIGFYLVALFAALTLNFAIPRLMPGDPVSAVLQDNAQIRICPSLRISIDVIVCRPTGNLIAPHFAQTGLTQNRDIRHVLKNLKVKK